MKKGLSLIVTLIMFVTIFSACSSKDSNKTNTTTKNETTTNKYEQKGVGDFQLGTWSSNVFTNTWSNIRITLPSKKYSYSSNKDLRKTYSDCVINGDNITSAINSGKTEFIDCEIKLPDGISNLTIFYDTDCKDISLKQYQVKIKSEFLKDDKYVFTGYSDENISGMTFNKANYAAVSDGFTMYMDTYLRKIDNSMFIMVSIYIDDSKADLTALLNSITDSNSIADTNSNRTSPKIQQ